MQQQRRDLMKVLSEKQTLERDGSTWYAKTVQKARFNSLDVTIQVRERL